MLGLVIIDMQKWMFRYPERAAQIPLLVDNINALTKTFIEFELPIFNAANSVFVGTDFDSALKAAGVTELLLTGVFIDGCIGLTAADAAQRGLEVTFAKDAP